MEKSEKFVNENSKTEGKDTNGDPKSKDGQNQVKKPGGAAPSNSTNSKDKTKESKGSAEKLKENTEKAPQKAGKEGEDTVSSKETKSMREKKKTTWLMSTVNAGLGLPIQVASCLFGYLFVKPEHSRSFPSKDGKPTPDDKVNQANEARIRQCFSVPDDYFKVVTEARLHKKSNRSVHDAWRRYGALRKIHEIGGMNYRLETVNGKSVKKFFLVEKGETLPPAPALPPILSVADFDERLRVRAQGQKNKKEAGKGGGKESKASSSSSSNGSNSCGAGPMSGSSTTSSKTSPTKKGSKTNVALDPKAAQDAATKMDTTQKEKKEVKKDGKKEECKEEKKEEKKDPPNPNPPLTNGKATEGKKPTAPVDDAKATDQTNSAPLSPVVSLDVPK